tara:strand:+ start:2374 stop:2664 length:291 start_codon:yes stop_codon:yes gene_type:complete
MSWEDILKQDFNKAIVNLEKLIYTKYRGDEVMRLLDKGFMGHEMVKLFFGVNKRLDKIAENPTKDDLIDFMLQYLNTDFRGYESAERWLNKQEQLQ